MSLPIRLRDCFPSLHFPPVEANLQVDWSAPADFENVVDILWALHDQEVEATRDPSILAGKIVSEIRSLKTRLPKHLGVLHLLQMAVCFRIMDRTMHSRELPQLWKWTIQSLHEEPVTDGAIEFRPFSNILDIAEISGIYAETRDRYFGFWLVPFFYCARKNGKPFHQLGDRLLPMAIRLGINWLPYPSRAKAGAMILIMAFDWEALRPGDRRHADVFQALYKLYNEGHLEDEIANLLGYMFATFVGERRGLNISYEARVVLNRYPKVIAPHEQLQLLCSVTNGGLENPHVYSADFADAIEKCHLELDGLSQLDAALRQYREGAIFSTMSILIRNLLNGGGYRFCLDLIRMWKRLPPSRFCQGNVLIVLPEQPHGVGYCYGEKIAVPGRTFEQAEAIWAELLKASNKALGDSHQLLTNEDFELEPIDLGRRDVVDYSAGSRFEVAMKAAYIPEELEDSLAVSIPRCVGIALIPYFAHCLPALMAKYLGKTLPFVSSWEVQLSDRCIKRALIYAGNSISVDAEVSELKRIFSASGIDCEICNEGTDGWMRFLSLYEDDSFDLVWIISHGEIDPMAPHVNYLSPHSSARVHPESMPEVPDAPTRRLLVLNICSGGKGAALGGLPDFGIAHTLVDSRQAVIAHLWPVNPFAAAYFGLLLASELVKSNSYFDAYSIVMKSISSNTVFPRGQLEALGCKQESMDRFEYNHPGWDNILNWGSAVFIQ